MADDRQPEDGSAQWDPSRGQEPIGTQGANGFSSSSYRTCQTGGAHTTAAPFSARENGFNGELTGAHAITAGMQSSLFCTSSHDLLKNVKAVVAFRCVIRLDVFSQRAGCVGFLAGFHVCLCVMRARSLGFAWVGSTPSPTRITRCY